MSNTDDKCPAPKLTVLGLGNILSGDDGIGVRLIQELEKESHKFADVEFVDAGVGGLRLLNLLEEVPAVLIVDSAEMNLRAGDSRIILPNQLAENQGEKGFSLHDISFAQTLMMAERFFSRPATVIFAIQPKSIEQSSELSEELEQAFGKIKQKLSEILTNWSKNKNMFDKVLLETDIHEKDKILLECLCPTSSS